MLIHVPSSVGRFLVSMQFQFIVAIIYPNIQKSYLVILCNLVSTLYIDMHLANLLIKI